MARGYRKMRSRSNTSWGVSNYAELISTWVQNSQVSSITVALGPFTLSYSSVTAAGLMRGLPVIGKFIEA